MYKRLIPPLSLLSLLPLFLAITINAENGITYASLELNESNRANQTLKRSQRTNANFLPPRWVDRKGVFLDFDPFFSATHFGGNILHYSAEFAFTLRADIDICYKERFRKNLDYLGIEFFVEPGIEGIRGGGGINMFPINIDFGFNQLSLHFQGTYFWDDRDHDGLSGKSFIGPEIGFEFFGSFKCAVLKEFQGDRVLFSIQGGIHFPLTWLAKL